MTSRASAARYARALLDVVLKEGNPEQVEQELSEIADLLSGSQELQKAFANPAVPVTAKRGIIEQLLSRAKVSPPLAKLLLLLADRERLELVPDLAASYREHLREHRQVLQAEVTTAAPLPPERLTQFQERLAKATGRRVSMTTRVDPALIGGAVTRVGSVVYDGSVASQLERLRERLAGSR